MKHIKILSIFLILVGMVSCIAENHNLKNNDFNIACAVISETEIISDDTFKIIYEDSIRVFDHWFHTENLIYVSNIVFEDSSLKKIDYNYVRDNRENNFFLPKDTIMLNIVWLQNHKGYVKLFEFLKNDRNFRTHGSLIYSHALSLIDRQNNFRNIYELYKTAFSTNPEEKRFAMETLEKLREEIAKNEKFGTPENIARYDHIIELIVQYNN